MLQVSNFDNAPIAKSRAKIAPSPYKSRAKNLPIFPEVVPEIGVMRVKWGHLSGL
jgi:hypothetical protein